jgi:hypothetical protein
MKYLKNGKAVELKHTLDNSDGFVVAEIVKFDSGEECEGELSIVHEIFDNPPLSKLHRKAEDITKAIHHKQKRRDEIDKEIQDKIVQRNKLKDDCRGYEDMIGNLTKHKALKNIEAFIEGKITHYVGSHYSEIHIIDRFSKENKSEYGGERRLLSLDGRSNGDLQWRLSRYSDDSGSWEDVVPCLSIEEAMGIAQAQIEKLIVEQIKRTENGGDLYYARKAVESANKLNLKVDEKWSGIIKDDDIKEATKKMVNRQEAFKKCEDELLKLTDTNDNPVNNGKSI